MIDLICVHVCVCVCFKHFPFLALQDAPVSSCIFSTPVLESLILQGVWFPLLTMLETNKWVLARSYWYVIDSRFNSVKKCICVPFYREEKGVGRALVDEEIMTFYWLSPHKEKMTSPVGLCHHHKASELPLLVSQLYLIEVSVIYLFIYFYKSNSNYQMDHSILLPLLICKLPLQQQETWIQPSILHWPNHCQYTYTAVTKLLINTLVGDKFIN